LHVMASLSTRYCFKDMARLASPKSKRHAHDILLRTNRNPDASLTATKTPSVQVPTFSMRLLWKMRDPRSSSSEWIRPERILGPEAHIPLFSRIVVPREKTNHFRQALFQVTQRISPIPFELQEPVTGTIAISSRLVYVLRRSYRRRFSSSNWIDKDEVNFQPHICGPFASYVYRLDVSKCESRALGVILGWNDPSGHFVGREILKFRE